MGPRFESVKVHQNLDAKAFKGYSMWPVGQVVKTAASHAVNIGSNPVRVTKNSLDRGREKVYNLVCSPVRPEDSWC